MQLYFGPVPAEFLNSMDSYFISEDGNAFYYSVTLTEDGDLVIEDTCGRSVPIDGDTLDFFAKAMHSITVYIQDTKMAFDRLGYNLCQA